MRLYGYIKKGKWQKISGTDDIIFYYKKLEKPTFNYLRVLEEYRPETAAKFKYKDERGFYQIRGKAIEGSPVNKADGLRPEHEEKYPGHTYRQYMKGGTPPRDWWGIPIVNKAANERIDYP
jgi:site-specific DNA-methyltransferase (adenine-specific)/adenine-specific DNA-methyltransferase